MKLCHLVIFILLSLYTGKIFATPKHIEWWFLKPGHISILKELNTETPIFMFLTLVGVKGYSMGLNPEKYIVDENNPIESNVLQLPEAILEQYYVKAEYVLKPSFYTIWNACGFQRSFNYNKNGEWAPL